MKRFSILLILAIIILAGCKDSSVIELPSVEKPILCIENYQNVYCPGLEDFNDYARCMLSQEFENEGIEYCQNAIDNQRREI